MRGALIIQTEHAVRNTNFRYDHLLSHRVYASYSNPHNRGVASSTLFPAKSGKSNRREVTRTRSPYLLPADVHAGARMFAPRMTKGT